MKTLVTGATGLVGNAVARRLLAAGHQVKALVRDVERARRVLPPEVQLARGDVTDPGSIAAAVDGADWVFHAAGLPEQWQADESVFERVNTRGTANVMDAALDARVRRAVYTSTMDVFAASPGGVVVEAALDPAPKPTAYERSKQRAEAEVELRRDRGLDVVLVNPCAVYGPGPVNVALNSFFIKLLNHQAPILPPGGTSLVFVDGLADAHLAAAERGRCGERYLLADAHVSTRQLAEAIVQQANGGDARVPTRVPPVGPVWLFRALAQASAPLARRLGFTPLISPGQLWAFLWNARVDCSKAERELGFRPTPLAEGVRRTIASLRSQGLVNA